MITLDEKKRVQANNLSTEAREEVFSGQNPELTEIKNRHQGFDSTLSQQPEIDSKKRLSDITGITPLSNMIGGFTGYPSIAAAKILSRHFEKDLNLTLVDPAELQKQIMKLNSLPSSQWLSASMADPNLAALLFKNPKNFPLDEQARFILALRLGTPKNNIYDHSQTAESLIVALDRANNSRVAENVCESTLVRKLTKNQLLPIMAKFPSTTQYILGNPSLAELTKDAQFLKAAMLTSAEAASFILSTPALKDKLPKLEQDTLVDIHKLSLSRRDSKKIAAGPEKDIHSIQNFVLQHSFAGKELLEIALANPRSAEVLLSKMKHPSTLTHKSLFKIMTYHNCPKLNLAVAKNTVLLRMLSLHDWRRLVDNILLNNRSKINTSKRDFLSFLLLNKVVSTLVFDAQLIDAMLKKGMQREVFAAAMQNKHIRDLIEKEHWLNLAKSSEKLDGGVGIDIVNSSMSDKFTSNNFIAIAQQNPKTQEIILLKHASKLNKRDLNTLISLLSPELLQKYLPKLLRNEELAKSIDFNRLASVCHDKKPTLVASILSNPLAKSKLSGDEERELKKRLNSHVVEITHATDTTSVPYRFFSHNESSTSQGQALEKNVSISLVDTTKVATQVKVK